MTIWILLGLAIAIVLWGIAIYNRLISLRTQVANGWSQIDVQLKRRYDLIPNLVETAKGYLGHEHNTLVKVTEARNIAIAAARAAAANPADAKAMQTLGAAESGLAGALSRLMVVSEQYPDLKASAVMMSLTEELTSTENKVAFSRQNYNDSVMVYNTNREQFPAVIFANIFGFTEAALFEITNLPEREAPKVSFASP